MARRFQIGSSGAHTRPALPGEFLLQTEVAGAPWRVAPRVTAALSSVNLGLVIEAILVSQVPCGMVTPGKAP